MAEDWSMDHPEYHQIHATPVQKLTDIPITALIGVKKPILITNTIFLHTYILENLIKVHPKLGNFHVP
jgi:hypothetical protein